MICFVLLPFAAKNKGIPKSARRQGHNDPVLYSAVRDAQTVGNYAFRFIVFGSHT